MHRLTLSLFFAIGAVAATNGTLSARGGSTGALCLNPSSTDGSQLCFSYVVDPAGQTITINAECTPPTFPPPVVGPVTWCAIGLNKPGNTNKMFQSNMWVFGPMPGATDGSAFVGDHLSMVRFAERQGGGARVCSLPHPHLPLERRRMRNPLACLARRQRFWGPL
jgi:hypothetical protein